LAKDQSNKDGTQSKERQLKKENDENKHLFSEYPFSLAERKQEQEMKDTKEEAEKNRATVHASNYQGPML
jgi:hypothetical protein